MQLIATKKRLLKITLEKNNHKNTKKKFINKEVNFIDKLFTIKDLYIFLGY